VSAAAFFDAARALKRELGGGGLSQGEVDALNAVIAHMGPGAALNPNRAQRRSRILRFGPAAFGALEQPQVDGFGALLQAYGVARWPLAFAAYGLATGWHETAKTMQPVREAYWLERGLAQDAPRLLSLVRARLRSADLAEAITSGPMRNWSSAAS
jgi:hypothetical protein